MASELKVDTINERTSNKGVKINKQRINASIYFAMGS